MVHHQGYIAGNVGHVALLSETDTAGVVLGNSAGLTDVMRLLGQILVETVTENEINATAYIDIAKTAPRANIQFVSDVYQDILDIRTTTAPTRSLSAYTGRYFNSIGNFHIDIKLVNDNLQVVYMGADQDTFDLQPYQNDSFF